MNSSPIIAAVWATPTQRDAVETSLWAAVIALEQQADVSKRLSRDSERAGRTRSARQLQTEAEAAERHAKVVRSMLAGSTQQ